MTVRIIQLIVAAHYDTTVERMMSRRRLFVIVRARHMAMYLARVLLDMSYPALGRAFGRDQTSVLDGFRRIEALAIGDRGVKADIDVLLERIKSHEGDAEGGACPHCRRPYETQTIKSVREDMRRLQARIEELTLRSAA